MKGRRSTLAIFFAFMLLHQVDRFLIGPLTTPIMDEFGIDEAQMGAILTGTVVVGALFFPLWGWLFDRYARPRILALASAVWGATTWLAAIAPTFGWFVAARATTGIDDATYPGIYSMVSDTYGPTKRGRVIAFLQTTGPIAFVLGTVVGLSLSRTAGWRSVFYLTGALGIVMAVLIATRLRDVPRGAAEPALAGVEPTGHDRFDRDVFLRLLRRPTMRLLLVQTFVHLFPIQALLLWSIRYFEVERGFSDPQIYGLSGSLVVVGIAGFLAAGRLGDRAFERTPRGRLLVGAAGVSLAAVSMVAAFSTPTANVAWFMMWWALASFFYGFSNPIVTPSVQDITEPEVRSTAHAAMGFGEQTGSALAPLVVGLHRRRVEPRHGAGHRHGGRFRPVGGPPGGGESHGCHRRGVGQGDVGRASAGCRARSRTGRRRRGRVSRGGHPQVGSSRPCTPWTWAATQAGSSPMRAWPAVGWMASTASGMRAASRVASAV